MDDSGDTVNGRPRKDAVINLKVRPERKEEWQNIANEEFDNLSQMVRQAVGQVHEGSCNKSEKLTGVASEEKVSELMSEVRSVQNQLDHLQTTVDAIAQRTKEAPENLKELANEVFGILPIEDEFEEWHDIAAESGVPTGRSGPPKVNSGSLADIAEELDEDEMDVQQALDHLQDTTHRVRAAEKRGETRWYKEV